MIPPTVTVTGPTGFGRFASAVPAVGAFPVDVDGDIAPAPVTNNVTVSPALALPLGTGARAASVKIAGAVALTSSDAVELWPLY